MLQRHMIVSFIYPIYNHNWKNISTVYIYITKIASNKIHREVVRAKDLSAPRYVSNVLQNNARNENVKFIPFLVCISENKQGDSIQS